ncbi:MAG: Ppx/GppA phosphatase family protein, partial [Pseudomonadota bacterium]
VARPNGVGFQVIDSFSRVVRLGEGLTESGRLSEAAMDRAVAALRICGERVAKHRNVTLRAIATEACRRAANGADFADRVRRETGVRLEIITAEEEARLAVAGCAPLLDPLAEELVVFDIGGGSTEVMWVDLSGTHAERRRALLMALARRADEAGGAPTDVADHIKDWISIPDGVVTLSDAFEPDEEDAEAARGAPQAVPDCFHHMERHVSAQLSDFAKRNGPLSDDRLRRLQLLGTSGTITTLAGVHLGLPRYTRDQVDGLWMRRAEVERVIERLRGLSPEGRRAIPCIGQDRAVNLMAGAAILQAVLNAWPTDRIRVADRGLREGILYGLMQEEAEGGRGPSGGGGGGGGGGRRSRSHSRVGQSLLRGAASGARPGSGERGG